MEREKEFAVGDAVEKVGGDYTFVGEVVAAFKKKSGAERYVVEDDRGVLHVYGPKNLRASDATPLSFQQRPPQEICKEIAIKLYELPNGAFINPMKIYAVIPRDNEKVPGIIEYPTRVYIYHNVGCVETLICRDMQEARELAHRIGSEINAAIGEKA